MAALTFAELLDVTQPLNEFDRLNDQHLNSCSIDEKVLSRIQGSLIGLAVGDALGAHVEFRPKGYLDANPVTEMQGGGTWGLAAGQWTDDTSMALCLGASLIIRSGFNGYDQLERYRRWYRNGYMSSTGDCFDIGKSTCDAIREFENRYNQAKKRLEQRSNSTVSKLTLRRRLERTVDVYCGAEDAAGNGPLMRLAPLPLFYHESEADAIAQAGNSAKLTHGSEKAIDACRFYSSLIWNAINGQSKDELLKSDFFGKHFSGDLHEDVMEIVNGSYKQKVNGYADGIRGKGYIINSLEAALWAFQHDDNSFETGVLMAVNLGDDTDTTAAIYGQLAGAVYGLENIPQRWQEQLFFRKFILTMAKSLYLKGQIIRGTKRTNEDETESDLGPARKRRPNGISNDD